MVFVSREKGVLFRAKTQRRREGEVLSTEKKSDRIFVSRQDAEAQRGREFYLWKVERSQFTTGFLK